MNFYKTIEYITEPKNKYAFIDEVGAAIGAEYTAKRITGQDAKKTTYAKNTTASAERGGLAYFTDYTSALIDRSVNYTGLIKEDEKIINLLADLTKEAERITDEIHILEALAIAKINGYTGTQKDKHPYFLEVNGNAYDLRKIEKFYNMLATKKEAYNSGIDIRLDSQHKKGTQALIMSSKHGIGIILPVYIGEKESIMNSPFCCNYKKFSNLHKEIEKAYIYGEEPEQTEQKTA